MAMSVRKRKLDVKGKGINIRASRGSPAWAETTGCKSILGLFDYPTIQGSLELVLERIRVYNRQIKILEQMILSSVAEERLLELLQRRASMDVRCGWPFSVPSMKDRVGLARTSMAQSIALQ